MRIIVFIGMPASGKGEASKVALGLGVPIVNMGDVIREEVRRRGVEASDVNTGDIATELRETMGADIVARRCLPKIENLNTPVVVVDGVRSVDEVECFKQAFGTDFLLVAVDSPFNHRLERMKRRERADNITDREGLLLRDERELNWGLGAAIEHADIVIENDGSLDEFQLKIKRLLEETI